MYFKLFITMFNLSAFTFGGGYVIVPMMRKKFVEQLKWIDEDEMLDLVAISQSLPGVLAVNASVLVGYRLKKMKGAIVSSLGTVLPPLIILAIVTVMYENIKNNAVVIAILKGMQVGVSALIFTVVVQMILQLIKDKNYYGILMFFMAISLAVFLKLNTVIIIALSIIIGTIIALYEVKNNVG